MNRSFVVLSLVSLLTFWGNELGSCSAVDNNKNSTEITLEEFKTKYEAIDKSYTILSFNIDKSYKTGLTFIKDWVKAGRKPLSSYYFGSSFTDPITNKTETSELKLANGLYCYYENSLVTKTYTDINEVKTMVDDFFNEFATLFIIDFTDLNETDYKYYLNEDNTLSYVYKEETMSFNSDGLLSSITSKKETIEDDNYVYEISDLNEIFTYELSREN